MDLFLNGPNFMRNGIIIPMLFKGVFFYELLTRMHIFQLKNYEHEGVSASIDSNDWKFSFFGLA